MRQRGKVQQLKKYLIQVASYKKTRTPKKPSNLEVRNNKKYLPDVRFGKDS